jgi:coenzyme F420 hydrogenase subunit beta
MPGYRIRDEMASIAEAPGKTWFWELEAGVIDAGRCVQCGSCVAACPSDSIGVGSSGLPVLVRMCTGCSLCWDLCPRGGLRYEATWKLTGGSGSGLGAVRQSYTARARGGLDGAQDGGVVSALLVAALEAGEIDGVLAARESPEEPWKGVAHLARTPDEVRQAAGSYYNQTMALAHLDLPSTGLPPDPRIAVVGTPCEIQGIKAMQASPWERGKSRVDSVVLTVALLCTKSFDYEGLMLREIRDKRGVALADVGRVDVIRGKMIVQDKAGATLLEEPVRDFHGAALKGCDECADFLGRGADLSVGSVGSPDGWSSVLARTAAGEKALSSALDRLEVRELERPEALEKLDALDKRIAGDALHRDFDPDGPLFIEYEDHLRAYKGTDRDVVVRDR